MIINDGDCDGILTDQDCDDIDYSSTIVVEDGDCDGVLTADDCDDLDSSSTTVATDGDCDGLITSADCDDTNATINPNAIEIWYCIPEMTDSVIKGDLEDGLAFVRSMFRSTGRIGSKMVPSHIGRDQVYINATPSAHQLH
jgi:hypothetical protein